MTLAMFKPLGTRLRKLPLPKVGKPKGVNTSIRKSFNYARIEEEVLAEIAKLPRDAQAQIPIAGTLPERMIALALVRLGYYFQWQRSEDGGRLRLGGAVVDFLVYIGIKPTIIRVQGDYWHSLPERKLQDEVQWQRLHLKGYRIFDAWESAIFDAWLNGRLTRFVDEGVLNAA